MTRCEGWTNRLNDGPDDQCENEATTGRAHHDLCEDCAANYDYFMDQIYDGPPDGDAWSGGFADNH